MYRCDVIQEIIDRKKARTYLEIGMSSGDNFFRVKAAHKIAVEPVAECVPRNVYCKGAECYICTSDAYFADAVEDTRFDVVFIDGLHTHAQSLKDVMNSLCHLNENGVIVMHDCNPPSESAAYPAESPEQAAADRSVDEGWFPWCGDVWKTICYLRSQKQDLSVFVLDCDFGLGVVTRGKTEGCLELSQEQLNEMTYKDLANNRESLLNLKREDHLFEFLGDLVSK